MIEIEQKINASKEYPVELHLEPTNNCNLDCLMCPRKESNRKVGHMNMGLLRRIIDEASGYHDGININFHKDGEPLLHPNIVEMIDYASNNRCVTHFNTNGLFLNEEKSKGLIKAGLDHLTISLSAPTIEGYEKLKKKREDFRKIEENVKRFMKIRDDCNKGNNRDKPFIRVKMLIMDESKDYIEEFKNKWDRIVDEAIIRQTHNWDGTAKTIGKNVSNKKNSNQQRLPCVKLWTNPAINWDGTVSLCCVDWNCRGIIGDLKKNTMREIWTSEKFHQLREAHLNNKYTALCENCDTWTVHDKISQEHFWLKKANKINQIGVSEKLKMIKI